MYLGYNTNGLAHHDLFEAVDLLADLGYRGVAVTIDHGALAPDDDRTPGQLAQLRKQLARRGLRSVVETGARFLLDPRHKHEPTLVSADPAGRRRRIEFYRHAIRCAAELGSDCVSLWSGAAHDGAGEGQLAGRLVAGLEETLRAAEAAGVPVALEPEPGMFIASAAHYRDAIDLLGLMGAPELLLTLDIGHLQCQGETPIPRVLRAWRERLVNVHIEDMRRGVHEHLMFGAGEIDFPPVLAALEDCGYRGGVYVELSRHSHEAPTAARRAYEFLTQAGTFA